MDEELKSIIATHGRTAKGLEMKVDDTAGLLSFESPEGAQTYALKPLKELYDKGTGLSTCDPQNDIWTPLLFGIEETIVTYDRRSPGLTDGGVKLALEKLAMSPEGECGGDVLCTQLQGQLRLLLSLNDYSRQDVKMGLKKLLQSVNRHNRMGGVRGYLNFIVGQYGGR